jgi:hypothetical protein
MIFPAGFTQSYGISNMLYMPRFLSVVNLPKPGMLSAGLTKQPSCLESYQVQLQKARVSMRSENNFSELSLRT